jgi:hypothetical protein
VDREDLVAIFKLEANFFESQHLTLSNVLKICTSVTEGKRTCLSNSHTNWHWLIDSENIDNCRSDESLELVNQLQWVTAGITAVSLCAADCVLLFPLQALKQECDKHPITSLH